MGVLNNKGDFQMSKIVIYSTDSEVIITTKKNEKKIKKEYFFKDSGRDISEYDRDVTDSAVISNRMIVSDLTDM